MKTEKIILWKDGEYTYPFAFGFEPNLRAYLHTEDSKERSCVIVVPGGGYSVCAPSEAEPVAKKFYDMGCNCFVLTYTTNLLAQVPLKEQPMKDLARAIRLVRCHADQYHIRKDALAVCGFSAGAHLCGSVCVHFDDIEDTDPAYKEISARPDGAIFCYPVITSGEYANEATFRALLGDEASEEERIYYSLEKQVKENTSPCFLWQTLTDEDVPVQNSMLFVKALQDKNIPFAYHMFSKGPHGMALADEDWANDRFGEPYVMEQTNCLIRAIREGALGSSEELKQLADYFSNPQALSASEKRADPEVFVWPELAWTFLRKTGVF